MWWAKNKMVVDALLILGICLVIFSYGQLVICYFRYKNVFIQDFDGFEMAKEITRDYDAINVVEAKNILISYYDSKRNVIRLTSRQYFGRDIFNLGLVYVLACYSCFYQCEIKREMLKKIFFRIDWCSKTMIFGLILSCFTYTIGDAKIGVVILGLLLIVQYFHFAMDIFKNTSIENTFSKRDMDGIVKVRGAVLFLSKMSFIGNLVFLLREFAIILGI